MQYLNFKLYTEMRSLKSFVVGENGQDLVEYAIVAALISLAATAGMKSVALSISAAFTNIATTFGTYTS
jgi:pilus assembly protein Flp/PilA